MIVISLLLIPVGFWLAVAWTAAIALFVIGWVFQFVGHYYEKKPPEFFKDWRFLMVGTRWWVYKTFGIRKV